MLVALTLTAFFTVALVQTCLIVHRGVSRWDRSVRTRQMLTATLHFMSRDVRLAGCNPYGNSSFLPIDPVYGPDGNISRFTLRHDKRGKEPGSGPDGDIQDPDERIEYRFDAETGALRRNHQPMALGILKNPEGAPPFELVEHHAFGHLKILLTAGESGDDMSLATSVCIRNPL